MFVTMTIVAVGLPAALMASRSASMTAPLPIARDAKTGSGASFMEMALPVMGAARVPASRTASTVLAVA